MSDKEYKARLLYIDAGDCKEVWEVKHINGGRQYVGRDTFDEHTWWTLCDAPYGYFERSGRIVPGVVFILCDAEWNPVARDGNDRTEFPTPYPTLEEASADAWAAVREQYPEVSKDGFGKWISGFADRPLSGADYMNWRDCQRETIQREVLSTFDYLANSTPSCDLRSGIPNVRRNGRNIMLVLHKSNRRKHFPCFSGIATDNRNIYIQYWTILNTGALPLPTV